ncbi:MAG: hypothetical protein IKS35_01805 [Clostridia bacterium]|nr:hypothetical protein [Clostridia bacterium]
MVIVMKISSSNCIFSFKPSYTISYSNKHFCCVGNSVYLYDAKTGKLFSSISELKYPNWSKFTSDNRLIIKNARGYYYVYDIGKKALIKIISPPKGIHGSTTEFFLTPDNKSIIDFACFFPYHQLMIVDINSGIKHLYPIGDASLCRVLFNDYTSEIFILVFSRSKNDAVAGCIDCYSIKYPFSNIEFTKETIMCGDFSHICFSCGTFYISDFKNQINAVNFNNKENILIRYKSNGPVMHLKCSKSGKYLAVVESNVISVIDVDSNTCFQSIDVEYGCFADFYDNDSKLLIGTWKKGYCVNYFGS